MYKKIFLILLSSYCFIQTVSAQTIYGYSLISTNGDTIHLSDYAGKKILFVNTAASSPLVYQYGKLEQLYQLYKDSLVIIAMPSNSFGNEQETDSVINGNVHDTYNISYVLSSLTEVTGDSMHAVYHWLTDASLNGSVNNPVGTDFQKFMIGTDGKLIAVFSSKVDPMSTAIQNTIKNIDEDNN